jgi:hypothetical protein
VAIVQTAKYGNLHYTPLGLGTLRTHPLHSESWSRLNLLPPCDPLFFFFFGAILGIELRLSTAVAIPAGLFALVIF